MSRIDTKIQDFCERRKFTSFWEAFDFLKMAAYEETEAILIASEIFKGDIWGQVINGGRITKKIIESDSFSASTSTVLGSGANGQFLTVNGNTVGFGSYSHGNSPTPLKEIFIELFLLTEKANPEHKSIYKSYVLTRELEEIPELESHIKRITIELTTQLAINMFNEGYIKLK